MKKIKLLIAILIALSFFARDVYAECEKMSGGAKCDKTAKEDCCKKKSHGRGGGDITYLLSAKELNLTDQQRAELEKIKRNFETEREGIRSELKARRMELEKILRDYNADKGEVEKKVGEMSGLNAKLLLMATMSRLEARSVLSQEQFEKARELIEKIRE